MYVELCHWRVDSARDDEHRDIWTVWLIHGSKRLLNGTYLAAWGADPERESRHNAVGLAHRLGVEMVEVDE